MPGEIALCLSGGGYRAAIFHLGAMLRLHERDELAEFRAEHKLRDQREQERQALQAGRERAG